jgi:hypothetical protein
MAEPFAVTEAFLLAAALTIAGVVYFAVRAYRAARAMAALKPSEAKLESGLDAEDMDEGFARDLAARARDKGAV